MMFVGQLSRSNQIEQKTFFKSIYILFTQPYLANIILKRAFLLMVCSDLEQGQCENHSGFL